MVSYQVEIATILDILQKNINAMIDICLFHSYLVWIVGNVRCQPGGASVGYSVTYVAAKLN